MSEQHNQAATEAASTAEQAVIEPNNGLTEEAALKALEEALQKAKEDWMRAEAEIQNVRRRGQEELSKAKKFAVEKFALELLAVKDSLEMALATEHSTAEQLRSGVELTLKQLAAAFEKQQLVEINPMGEKLDPNRHQAISMFESEQEVNTVVQVMQKGYALAERVIRPALVAVSKGKN